MNDRPELQWEILNENIAQKYHLSVVIFRFKLLQKLRIFPK
jgi:hypothetical protein